MADNIVAQLLSMPWPVIVTDPVAPASGDPVRVGALTGIALNDEGLGGVPAATYTMVDFGLFVATMPVTDTLGAVAVGDTLFYVDAGDRLENTASGTPFGIALGTVGAGLTASISVLHSMGLGSGSLGAGTIATANLAAGILSADANGRAKMAADFFNAATVLTKFDADSFDNANLLLTIANGAFQADAGTRALFADGFVTGAKMAASFLHVTLIAGAAAGAHVCTGMAVGDEIVFVGHLTTAAAIATMADLTSEFTAGVDDANNAAGTDTTNDQLMVIWVDKT